MRRSGPPRPSSRAHRRPVRDSRGGAAMRGQLWLGEGQSAGRSALGRGASAPPAPGLVDPALGRLAVAARNVSASLGLLPATAFPGPRLGAPDPVARDPAGVRTGGGWGRFHVRHGRRRWGLSGNRLGGDESEAEQSGPNPRPQPAHASLLVLVGTLGPPLHSVPEPVASRQAW